MVAVVSMIGLRTVQARGTTLLEVHNVGARGLVFRFHKIIDRIARRWGSEVALRWTQALVRYKGHINEAQLLSAVASGNLRVVESVVNAHALQLTVEKALRDPLLRTIRAAGTASATYLQSQGIAATFNAIHANVILYAQTKAAQLVTSIPEDVREAIRLIVSLGAAGRATVQQQARLIKEVVGLPRNWVLAPLRFGDELREIMRTGVREYGTFTRRLSGADMAMIRSRIEAGELTPAFINDMEALYAQRLIAARAETIARTETLGAANWGAQESWRQAVQDGGLPGEVKQFWIVTPDDRLCPICVEIPGMNPDGVGLGEPFETPEGPVEGPPAPHPNCRCSVGLVLPGVTGPEE
jgi:hypothetical protein